MSPRSIYRTCYNIFTLPYREFRTRPMMDQKKKKRFRIIIFIHLFCFFFFLSSSEWFPVNRNFLIAANNVQRDICRMLCVVILMPSCRYLCSFGGKRFRGKDWLSLTTSPMGMRFFGRSRARHRPPTDGVFVIILNVFIYFFGNPHFSRTPAASSNSR